MTWLTPWSAVRSGEALHSKRPSLFDCLGLAVLAVGVVSSLCLPSFDICSVVRVTQNLHLCTFNFASAHTADGEDTSCRRGACCCVFAPTSTYVVISNEARFEAVEERFEIEATSGGDTQALNYLGADSRRPGIEGRICGDWSPVPEDELANTSNDDTMA